MRKSKKIPARKTQVKVAGPKKNSCGHTKGHAVLHHDHVYDLAKEMVRRKVPDEKSFSLEWQKFLPVVGQIAFPAQWICNHCNEQDGALKPKGCEDRPWFSPQNLSYPPEQLKQLYEKKRSSGIEAMRDLASELKPAQKERLEIATRSLVNRLQKL